MQDLTTMPAGALVDTKEAARLLALSALTLEDWRRKDPDRGPKAIRLGRAIRYRISDLRAWLDAAPTIGGGAPAGAA